MALLGELETKVMEVLWRTRDATSVRDVHTVLLADRDLAYTTVMTVLDRLAKKGRVNRERDGRQWLYTPVQSREKMVADEIMELLSGEAADRWAVLAELAGRLEEPDRRHLTRELGNSPD